MEGEVRFPVGGRAGDEALDVGRLRLGEGTRSAERLRAGVLGGALTAPAVPEDEQMWRS